MSLARAGRLTMIVVLALGLIFSVVYAQAAHKLVKDGSISLTLQPTARAGGATGNADINVDNDNDNDDDDDDGNGTDREKRTTLEISGRVNVNNLDPALASGVTAFLVDNEGRRSILLGRLSGADIDGDEDLEDDEDFDNNNDDEDFDHNDDEDESDDRDNNNHNNGADNGRNGDRDEFDENNDENDEDFDDEDEFDDEDRDRGRDRRLRFREPVQNLADFDALVITIESENDTNDSPSGDVLFTAPLPHQ